MASTPKRLLGKIAIVTASTDGIGLAIAERLAQEGAKVIISSRKEKNVNRAVNELKAQGLDVEGLVCHVSNAGDRKKLFDRAAKYGALDILVSNAAVNPEAGEVLDCSEESWDKVFEVNLKAAFLLTKEAVPLLKESKAGRIIYISSLSGFQPVPLLGAYGVSKTALFGLTKAVASQLASEGITVNCVAPGLIQTKFSFSITGDEETRKQTVSLIPMNRVGVPRDISGVVAFLASDDADYITGEIVVAAGGMPSRL